MILVGERTDGGKTLELTYNMRTKQDVLAMITWQIVINEGVSNLLPWEMIELPLDDQAKRAIYDGLKP